MDELWASWPGKVGNGDPSGREKKALSYTLYLVLLYGRIRRCKWFSLLSCKRFLEKSKQSQRGECRIFLMMRPYSFSRVDLNFLWVKVPSENLI